MAGIAILSSVMYRVNDLKTKDSPSNYFGVDFIINLICNRILTVCKRVSLAFAVVVMLLLFGIIASIMNQGIDSNKHAVGPLNRNESFGLPGIIVE